MEKKTQGRKKIDIEKIKRKDYLQVAFSKRRNGLFKKASELCTLCGAETAIIVFSPAGKPFSFGHPCVESVMEEYLNTGSRVEVGESSTAIGDPPLDDYHRNIGVNELNKHLTELVNQLEAEKQRGEILSQIENANKDQNLWNTPIDKLKFHELEQLRVSMEELKLKVMDRTNDLLKGAPSHSFFMPVNEVGRIEGVRRGSN